MTPLTDTSIAEAVLTQAPAIVVLLELDGRVQYVNGFFEQLTGWKLAEIRGRDWFTTVLPPRDRERIREVFTAAKTGAPTRGNLNPVVGRDGREHMIEWNDQLWRDEHGVAVSLLAIGIDVSARVEAELALRKTHQHLKTILAAIPDLLFETSADGTIHDFHAHQLEDLAVPPEQFLGKRFRDVLPAESAQACQRAIDAAAEHGRGLGPAYALQMPGGERWYEPSAARKSSSPGEGSRFVLLARDVTERVAAERAIRLKDEQIERGRRQLAEAQRIAHIGSWELDLDTHAAIWSDETYRIVEVDLQQRSGLFELFVARLHPDDRAAVLERLRDAVERGTPLDETARLLFADGRIKHIRQRADRILVPTDASGHARSMVGTLEDVTERIVAEQVSRAQDEKLRALIAHMPLSFWYIDGSERFRFMNEGAGRLVGHAPVSAIGRTVHEVLGDADYAVFAPRISAALAGSEVNYVEVRTDASGRSVTLQVELVPDRRDGQVVGYFGYAADVTAFAEAEAARRQSETQLKEAQRIAKVGSWELDLITNVLHWSDEVFRIFQLDRAHFAASYEGFLALVHPEDREAVEDAYARSVAAHVPYAIQHRLCMPDGSVKYVHERCETEYDASGAPVRSLGTVQDVTERVEAERRVGRMLDAMLPYVAILDVEGRVLEVNRAPLTRYGLQRDARLGKKFVDSPPWRSRPEAQAKIRDGLARAARGESVRYDLPSQLPNGDTAYVDLMFGPLHDASGKVESIIVSGIDVSDRKAAEERLRASEARYRAVVATLSEGILLASADGTITACNEAAARLLGVAAEELVARRTDDPAWRVVRPDGTTVKEEETPGALAVRTGLPHSADQLGLIQANGTLRWYAVSAAPIVVEGAPQGSSAVVSFADITERVEAEQRLQQTRDHLEATLQAIPDLLFETDSEHHYVDFRAVRREFLLADPAEFMTKRIEDTLPADAWRVVSRALAEAFETGLSFGHVYSLELPGGTRWFELSVARKRDSAGGAPTCVSLARDITERMQAQEAVQKLNADLEARVELRTSELEAANRELKTFAYSVSHDLKAPLRSIDGYTRLVLQDQGDRLDEDGRRMLTTVRNAATQMNQLIDDLLSYSQLEQQAVVSELLDTHAIVQGLLEEQSQETRERAVNITLNEICRAVVADRNALKIALRNLIDNALKFTREVAQPTIEIGDDDRPSSCVIWIRDNGPGFDMKFHDRIFEMFQRLQRAEAYPGTGVGLAIVRKAAQRMGGRVWAKSAPGEGATFYLEIPK